MATIFSPTFPGLVTSGSACAANPNIRSMKRSREDIVLCDPVGIDATDHIAERGLDWRPRAPRHTMTCMFRRILLLALGSASLIFAADPTGTWAGDQPGRDGNTYHITFKLKADNGKLTGTMAGDQFEQPIANAELHGDDISFTVHLEFGDGIDLKYTGRVGTDKIDFKVQRNGSDQAQPFVAKKSQ